MTIQVTGVERSSAFDVHLTSLISKNFASRLFAKDASLWGPDAEAEAAVRLGWTDFEGNALALIPDVVNLREEFAAAGIDRFVLCGMGGSSLAPLVIAPGLTVIDSTHPEAVREALGGDLTRTAVILSSKSGSTVEVLNLHDAFAEAFSAVGIEAASRFVFVTDPGSPFESMAKRSGSRCFLADQTVGGRFSALTAYGIVPSVLAGEDFYPLVKDAATARESLSRDDLDNPALIFAAAIASGIPERFLLPLHTAHGIPANFGLWVEQLVAESTGKDGRGVLPIAGGTPLRRGEADFEAVHRLVITANNEARTPGTSDVTEAITVTGTVGEQILLWEVMTAALGYLLEVDPFNQPDVEAAKHAARERLGGTSAPVEHAPDRDDLLAKLREKTPGNAYVMIQSYVNTENDQLTELLQALCERLSVDLDRPVALGWGPRYLHSTGQLHKGGPATGLFLQLIDTGFEDLNIPGSDSSFGALLYAQAEGDADVLRERGRPVITVATHNIASYLQALLTEQ